MTINLTTFNKGGTEPFTNDDERAQFEALDKLIDSLRPIFMEEGGDAKAVCVRDGVARIAFGGGCEGCGGALESMEGGLRLMIQERIPGLREVVFE
ncbi:NifU family protein [candidate division KSB1 bacterium]|nr:NifU family protein [candidate division KSB1 bacterium]